MNDKPKQTSFVSDADFSAKKQCPLKDIDHQNGQRDLFKNMQHLKSRPVVQAVLLLLVLCSGYPIEQCRTNQRCAEECNKRHNRFLNTDENKVQVEKKLRKEK